MAQRTRPPEPRPIRIDRILLATDFSDVSAAALPYAAAVARRFGSTLYVAHVIPPFESSAPGPAGEHDAALSRRRMDADARITAWLTGSQFTGIRHRVVLLHGEVWPVLSSLVEEHDIDLLVAGSHGRHGVQKLLAGSVAEEIFRGAPRPVLLVGPTVTVAPDAEGRIARILHVTDFSPESRPALDYAYAMAKAYEAHLSLLHVIDDVWDEPRSTQMTPEAFFRRRMLERGWPGEQEGIAPEFLIEFGAQEAAILEAADKLDAQLIVLGVPGTSHPDPAAHLPGPLAYNVMSHARCPVLGVRGAR